jgi:mannose/cellobiose epimerase-like protein (N-acyl-D-glucosamine 2-epimerase family)
VSFLRGIFKPLRTIPALGLYSGFELNEAVHDLRRVSWAVKTCLKAAALAAYERAAETELP